jgi:uncharacterized protein YndB with AHSA1/START domain
MSQNDENLVLMMQRVFKASPEKLFDAWTKPEWMKQWFHAKESWTTPVAESDLRVGGKWRAEMRMENGHIHHSSGEYRVIERPHKLVFTWHPYGDETVVTVVTLRFKKLSDDSTELTLTHEGLRNEKEKADHTGGWTGCLQTLEIWANKP